MTVRILRWKGGAGGDMLLYMKSLSTPGSVLNAAFSKIESTGQTILDRSSVDFSSLREIDKMALNPDWIKKISKDKLSQELEQYAQRPTLVWLKSHYYGTDLFKNYTLDLVVDPISLPFVILSNLAKTDTLTRKFNNLTCLIKDSSVRLKYSMYSVGKDCIDNHINISAQQISVSNLLVDVDTFIHAISKTSLDLDFVFSNVYQRWLYHNREKLPSPRYYEKIQLHNFDFMDTDLTLAERYSLLVLSGNKFINLC